jgi:hypothetical protein
MSTVFIALALFLIFLTGLVWLRARSDNRIDIKNADVVLALVPVALWLFLTGKIQEFGFGEVKIVAAFKTAAKESVDKQLSKVLPVEAVRVSAKGGTNEIQRAIDEKSRALSFTLGRGNYYSGSAISEYLDRLTEYPYLRYLVLNNSDGTFFGLADARQTAEILRSASRPRAEPANLTDSLHEFEQRSIGGAEPRLSAQKLADWLNAGSKAELETLPGFIPAASALDQKTDRQKALERMNTLDVQTIPVVDENRRFAGIVDRSKLTASILTEVAAKVQRPE